jgi:hypothetical protein
MSRETPNVSDAPSGVQCAMTAVEQIQTSSKKVRQREGELVL